VKPEPEPVEQQHFTGAGDWISGPAPGMQIHLKCYKNKFHTKNVKISIITNSEAGLFLCGFDLPKISAPT
jgi:hypothetical protein